MAIYLFGPYRLDAESRTLSLGGTDLAVGSKVVDTLAALAERAGRVCTTQELLDRIWPEGFTDPASLRQNIYVLRRVLRAHWDAPVIEGIRRTGYRFVAPLRVVEPARETPAPHAVPALPRRPVWRWGALAACALLAIGALHSAAGPAEGAATALNAQDARLYALGRYYWNTRTRDGVLKSVKYFQRVVQAEPENALGYSGLADAYYMVADYGYGNRSEQTYYEWERRNADKALALNPNLSEVRTSHALALEVAKKLKAARAEYARAIELNPNNAVAHLWYGILLFKEGQTVAGRAELETSEQLDPTAPAVSRWLAMADYLNRRYERAIAFYRQTLDLSPKDSEAAVMLGLAYEGLHDYAAALRSFHQGETICGCPMVLALEARTLALMGMPTLARAKLTQAQRAPKDPKKEKIDPLTMAAALVAMGQRDQAIAWVQRALTDQFAAVYLRLDPRLDALRGDPRFNAILGKSEVACTLSC